MRNRRASRRRAVVITTAAVVVLGGAGVAWAETRSPGAAYRTAVVERADVDQTVTEVGTISSINQRTVSFPVAGTVSTLSVALGDEVTAGQRLATLNLTDLNQTVESAKGDVASARQRLADDEASQSASSDSTDSLAAHPLGSSSAVSVTPKSGAHGGDVAGAQARVIADQARVDSLLSGPAGPSTPQVLSADIAAMNSACAVSTVTFTATTDSNGILHGTVSGAAGLPVSLVDATDLAGNAVTGSQQVASDNSFTFGSVADPLRSNAAYTVQLGDVTGGLLATTTCAGALKQVQADELQIQAAEQKLFADEQALDQLVQASNTGSTGSTGGSGSGGGSSSNSGNGSQSGPSSNSGSGASRGSTGSTSGTVTAAQLAADQKQIDAANAMLVVDTQNLASGTLDAPIAGKVAEVSISVGDRVSASSSTETITIIGSGQKAVTTTVGIADIDSVKKGDSVSVTIDGVSTALPGKVTEVGVLNTSGTSGTTSTYPVTVVLDATSLNLYDGAGATVAIHVGTAKNVLTVPTSALSKIGTGYVVSVLRKGKLVRTVITVGVAGIDRSEVLTGLTAGERVVLANLHEAVPTSTNNARLGRLVSGGNFAGGGTFVGRAGGTGGK
jgi:multidrug efflux pump subunit AcrA (membrane-fusion protein)